MIRPSLSLERKLPLLIAAPLVVIVAITLIVTYGTLTRSAAMRAIDRLERAVGQLAITIGTAIETRATTLASWAADPELVRELGGPPDVKRAESLEAILGRLRPDTSTRPMEIRDVEGRRLAYIGREAGDTPAEVMPLVVPVGDQRGQTMQGPRSVSFGPLHRAGDRVVFWVAAPIIDEDRVLGFLAEQRLVTGPQAAAESLGDLIGEDVLLSLRNASGDLWVRAPGAAVAGPERRDSIRDGLTHTWPDVGRTLAAEASIAQTPWVVVLETPTASVDERPRTIALLLSLFSLLLIVGGVVYSQIISRGITRPLVALTTAAESVARGDYGRRVDVESGDEIGRLSAAFNQMATDVATTRRELELQIAEAQRANRAKSDFLAVMSHELRTPLNAIGGYAQLLEMGVHGPINESQREALARLGRSQAHLLGLINDVLNFAKLEAGHVRYAIADVPLAEALDGLEELVEPQVRVKGLTFAIAPLPPALAVRADREKLRQIVLNLLSNAIKFTPPGGKITLDCSVEGQWVSILVTDTGIGIASERLEAIFEPFVQVDRALNRPHEGVGLGLAISRDLARGMHGDLTVESSVGRGSTFTLVLPAAVVTGDEVRSVEEPASTP